MVVLALVISGTLVYYTFLAAETARQLSAAADQYIELQNAADGLIQASDYLTEMAQHFTAQGDRQYMDAYFEEANVMKRREQALSTLEQYAYSRQAEEELRKALEDSQHLMNLEYYAMRLTCDAMGYTDLPAEVAGVELAVTDAALPAREKLQLAQRLLIGELYYGEKDRIREDMNKSQQGLVDATKQNKAALESSLETQMLVVRIIIAVQIAVFLLMLGVTMLLGIRPVLAAVHKIREGSRIPAMGAREFRYLAQEYNKMYEHYHASIRHLNYKASHDELTGVYNRAGYDLLLSGVELKTTWFLLIDVDNFKKFNDDFGHEVGDRVLQKTAQAIRRHFRADDYVCRIGGDEFVVMMTHADAGQQAMVADKLTAIRRDLAAEAESVPAITVSIGAAHGCAAESTEELFEQADRAMYETKRRGRNGYTFYRDIAAAEAAEKNFV